MPIVNHILSQRTKDDLRSRIETAYVRSASDAILERDSWRLVSDVTETSSRILASVTSVLSFAASTYKNPTLSFVAGVIGATGVALAGFSVYASKESRERLARLNAVLMDVDMRPVKSDDSTPEISAAGGDDIA
jgi:uncharacterized membrane protein